MVHLVLGTGRPEASEMLFVEIAIKPEPADPDLGRALYLGILLGDRQAARRFRTRLASTQWEAAARPPEMLSGKFTRTFAQMRNIILIT